MVKRRGPNAPIYAIGMERVAYALAAELGLPVAQTYLENFEGAPASVQIRVPGRSYRTSVTAPMMTSNILNKRLWPTMVAFDIWLANTDRNPGNMYLIPHPPTATPGKARGSVSWLIDHGQTGLWPGWKLTANNADMHVIADDPATVSSGLCHPDVERHIRNIMFADLENSFVNATPADRQVALDAVQAVSDDAVAKAIDDVPPAYFTPTQADALKAFLQARRRAVDKVVTTYW